MDFFNTWIGKGIIDRLRVTWGCDLKSENERYITEVAFGGCPEIDEIIPRRSKRFICGKMMMEKLLRPWICWFLGYTQWIDDFQH